MSCIVSVAIPVSKNILCEVEVELVYCVLFWSNLEFAHMPVGLETGNKVGGTGHSVSAFSFSCSAEVMQCAIFVMIFPALLNEGSRWTRKTIRIRSRRRDERVQTLMRC